MIAIWHDTIPSAGIRPLGLHAQELTFWAGRGGRGTRADAEAPIAHFIELESAALPRMILRCRGAKRRPDARSSGGVISRMTWAKIAPRCARQRVDRWLRSARGLRGAALAVRVLATSEATHSRPIRGRGRFGQYGG